MVESYESNIVLVNTLIKLTISSTYTHESVASGMVAFHHISGDIDPADVLSKHWGHSQVYPLLRPLLFYRGNPLDLLQEEE